MNEPDRVELPDAAWRSMVMLLRELVDGPPGQAAYILNVGDPGLLASLDRLTAAMASARPQGRSSVAAHVDHLRYGFELLNRWMQGEDPWRDSDYAASWKRQMVTDEEWATLRANLRREAHAWIEAVGRGRPMSDPELGGVIGSIAHLGYHLGAIRQVTQAAAGPPARD